MRSFWLITVSFLTSFFLCWLAWIVGVPFIWLGAVSIAQVGVMWWRMPWAIGSSLGLAVAGWWLQPALSLLWIGFIILGFLVQWLIPALLFERFKLPYDLSSNYGIVFGLLAVAGFNTGISALFIVIAAWQLGIIPAKLITNSLALIWLVHYLTALVITIPCLRYGTQYLRHRGIFASKASFYRGIQTPKMKLTDIGLVLVFMLLVIGLYLLIEPQINLTPRFFNVLLLFPIAILLIRRGLDGVFVASPLSFATALILLWLNSRQQVLQRADFATTIFELGIYYLVGIGIGLLVDNQREEQRKLTSISDINRLFLSSEKNILQQFVERVRADTSATACVVMGYDPDQRMLEPQAWTTKTPMPKRLTQPIHLSHYPDIKAIIEARQSQAFHSTATDMHASTSAFWVETGYTSAMWVPLNDTNATVGMVAVLDDRPERFFTSNELGFVSAICVYVAAAFGQSRLITGLREKTEQLRVVSDIAATLNASLNDDLAVYRRIAEQIATVIPYDWGCVALPTQDPADFRIVVEVGNTHNRLADYSITLSSTTMQAIEELDHTSYRVDLDKTSSTYAPELRALEFQIILIVPIRRDNTWLGLVVLTSTDPLAFPDEQRNLLHMLMQHMALAIANAQLYQQLDETYRAKEKAHEALLQTERLRALGELSTGIAHDFNNLLTGILGHTQLMLIEAPVQQHEGLAIIEQAARDGRRMIERIQQFARSQQSHQFEMVSLNDIVDDVIQLTRPRWFYRPDSTKIRTKLTLGTLPTIYGSPFALREVLMNLILNAIDAMPHGGELRIFTMNINEGVVLEVSDSGIGMDEVTRTRMWEPFFSTKGNRGTGLGLSMTHAIVVQQHGGSVQVESEVDQGTIIRIIFPIPVKVHQELEASPLPTLDERLRILIVESDVRVRSALEGILINAGYHAKCVESGQAALAAYTEQYWDMLIVDSNLTDMSAWDLTEQLKLNHPQILSILLSMWEDDPLNQRRLLFDSVLPKPFEADSVIQTIQTLVQQRLRMVNQE